MIRIIPSVLICLILCTCKGLSQPENVKEAESESQIGEQIDHLGVNVSRVFQDSKGNYWFANNGAVKYDGERFIRFTTEDGMYDNRVRDFQEDHLGNIYFDTGQGVNKYNGTSIEKLTVISDNSKAKILTDTDLWFAGNWNMNGAYRCDGEYLYQLRMPEHPLDEEARAHANSSYSLYTNYSTFRDAAGNVWFGGSTFGACRFDGNSFLWVSEREMTEIDPGPAMGVRSIVQDSEGYLYFASNISSKYRIIELDGVPEYQKLDGINTSEEENVYDDCISMEVDDQGNFWMANYRGGIWKYDGKTFKHYPILINNEEADLFSVYKDRQGVLWLGTHNAGTFRFNGEKFERFNP